MATLLATRAPVVICPAMHTEMWEHPAVQDNLRTLAERGVTIVPPAEGRLADGDVGAGRLAEPGDIVAAVERFSASRTSPARSSSRPAAICATARPRPLPRQPLVGQAGPRHRQMRLRPRGAKVTLVTTANRPAAAGVEIVPWRPQPDGTGRAQPQRRRRRRGQAAAVADFRPP